MAGGASAADSLVLDVNGGSYTPTGQPNPNPTRVESHGTVNVTNGGWINAGSAPYGTAYEVRTAFNATSGGSYNRIFGAANFTKTTGGDFIIRGTFDLDGTVAVNDGYFSFEQQAQYTSTSAITLGSPGATLWIDTAANHVFVLNAATVSGNGEVVMIQAGTAEIASTLSDVILKIQNGVTRLTSVTGLNRQRATAILGGSLVTTANDQLGRGLLQLGLATVGSPSVALDVAGTSQIAGGVTLWNGSVINDSVGGGQLLSTYDFQLIDGVVNVEFAGDVKVTKSGTANEEVVLNAINTYTGLTEVLGGTLKVGAGVGNAIGSSSGLYVSTEGNVYGRSPAIANEAARFDVNGNDIAINGIVEIDNGGVLDDSTGGGTLSAERYLLKSGRVAVTLAGNNTVDLVKENQAGFPDINTSVELEKANTYEGRTHVKEGVLIARVGDAIAASSGLTVENSRRGANTVAVFDVAGNDVAAQGVHLIDGVLEDSSIAGTGILRSGSDFILENGDVNVELAGAVNLRKQSSGIVNLNVANSYLGDTLVDDGTLNLFADNALPTGTDLAVNLAGRVNLNGTSQKVSGLHNGVLPTGGYDVNGGIIDLGASILNEFGELEVGHNNASSRFTGAVIGSGEFAKVGDGTLVLDGVIDISGLTGVLDGNLHLVEHNGVNILGDAYVGPNGALTGNGRIGGNLRNDGLVSPGNSAGAILITGDYVQTPFGTLLMEIEANQAHDRLFIGGQAFLEGDLVVNKESGYKPYRNDRFMVLRAEGGRNGQFDRFFHNFANNTMLKVVLDYDPQFAWVVVRQRKFANLKGLTHNQRQVAKALDHAAYRNQINKAFDHLNYTHVSNVPGLLSEISPEQLTSIFTISAATSQIQNVNLERRLDDVRNGSSGFSANGLSLRSESGALSNDGALVANTADGLTLAGWDGKSIVSKEVVAPMISESRWGFFATGHGEWANIKSTQNAAGQEFTSAGFTLGADYRVSENFVVGLHGGYTNTQSDLLRGGSLDVDGGRGGVYASWFGSGAYVNAAVGGGYNSYRTRRGTLGGLAHGDSDGAEFNALLGGGYDYQINSNFSIGPVASVQYTYTGLNSFTETGSSAPLHFTNQHADSLRTLAGLKFAGAFNAGSVVIRPEVRAQWKHEYMDSTPSISSRFSGGNAVFTVDAPDVGRDSLVLDAGASVEFNSSVSVFAYYTGELGRKNYDSHSVNGGFRVAF